MKTNQITVFASLVFLTAAPAWCSEANDTAVAGRKPNVVFIAIDDLNDWNGMLKGHPQARTPHMDRLASRGMLFTNAHCAAPACGPSRSAIMSGIRPSTSGNYENRNSLTRNPILNNSVLLPEFFQLIGIPIRAAGLNRPTTAVLSGRMAIRIKHLAELLCVLLLVVISP